TPGRVIGGSFLQGTADHLLHGDLGRLGPLQCRPILQPPVDDGAGVGQQVMADVFVRQGGPDRVIRRGNGRRSRGRSHGTRGSIRTEYACYLSRGGETLLSGSGIITGMAKKSSPAGTSPIRHTVRLRRQAHDLSPTNVTVNPGPDRAAASALRRSRTADSLLHLLAEPQQPKPGPDGVLKSAPFRVTMG